MNILNPLFMIDFYKVGHVSQYPNDTEQVWSNWTPRASRIADCDGVVFFGLQYYIQKVLVEQWQKEFFHRPLELILAQYRRLIKATLGVENPKTDHIEALHGYGRLPITIYALPEGTVSPLRVPQLVITNTTKDSFWLPNYLETQMSNYLWKASTSATTARRYRKIFLDAARKFGEQDLSFVDWMGHDFSYRGMSGLEDAELSGMGHLLSFSGTDTIPAIIAAHDYYGAELTCGGSVPATEHSVMCAGGKEDELKTFLRLIEEIYPTGIVSVVSDTWDLWKVLDTFIPALKDKILARDGKLVIRPDSGDPVKIMCGDPQAKPGSGRWNCEKAGTLGLLAKHLGIDDKGHINKAGAIYGDSITPERAQAIMDGTIRQGLSPYNVVLGIGSFTYELVTRDVYGFAMKATAVQRGGKIVPIFKKPFTDNGDKFSCVGIPVVVRDDAGKLVMKDMQQPEALDHCAFEKVFDRGHWVREYGFADIRKRVREGL